MQPIRHLQPSDIKRLSWKSDSVKKNPTYCRTTDHPSHMALIQYKLLGDPPDHSCTSEQFWTYIYGKAKDHHKPLSQQACCLTRKIWTQWCIHTSTSPPSTPCQLRSMSDQAASQSTRRKHIWIQGTKPQRGRKNLLPHEICNQVYNKIGQNGCCY